MPRFTGLPPVDIRGPRPLPLVGAIPNILRFFGDPAGRMLALHREFGDVVAVSDRSPALVCAFGAERNREVLTQPEVFEHDDEVPVKAPKGSSLERFNAALPFMNGDAHRRRRRVMMPAFQKTALDGYAADIVAVATDALSRWPIGNDIDGGGLLRELTSAVTLRCLFGLDALDPNEELARAEAALLDALTSPLALALPLSIPGTPFWKALRMSAKVEARLRQVIAERRARPPSQRDVLSILVHAQDEDGATLSDDNLVGEANGLFVAGHDTSAQTLTWTLFLLAQHPDVLGDVKDEVDAVLRGAPPTVDDVDKLVLVDRVLKEGMRVLPAGPMLFIRVCKREAPLGAHTLPEGANVVLSPLVTHRDPERYPEPIRFRPSRWQGLDPSPHEYLPFGAGKRMCLGAGFATLALRLVLPMILQRALPSLPEGTRVSRKVRGFSLGPKDSLPLTLRPRDLGPAPRTTVRGDIHELVDLS